MFTGIVKAVQPIVDVKKQGGELKIHVRRPRHGFSLLKAGDSVAVDGICLTLEKLLPRALQFHLGAETLKITGFSAGGLKKRLVNLEPALKAGAPLGGHFVSGHIDGMAQVFYRPEPGGGAAAKSAFSRSCVLKVKIPARFKKFVWKKSFIALNGVSLTVNEIKSTLLWVCLVPETIKRTNLKSFLNSSGIRSGRQSGIQQHKLTFEADYLARAAAAAVRPAR